MGSTYSILMIVVLFVLMYFLMIRPQQKQEKKRREQLSKLAVGDNVVTIGRLHGVIDEINEAEKTVTLDCDGIFLTFDLNAIAQVKERAVASSTKETSTTEQPAEPKEPSTETSETDTKDSDSEAK
ncbi:preprotein translocase subunit YajC [Lentilactobacillus senioris]|nr:preprotein translocase subunit YajC [Lentilactobacillus senioris]MCY9807319.1 preprotein translocase subunit YajC [Lentilactobacillus senioris]